MADAAAIDIPNRALFKPAEVCDIVKVQPYVLRTWEAEFPELGVSKTAGGPRIYRRSDVEQVARIKHLLLVDGLTLAGARRKLEEETAPVAAHAPLLDELIGQHARERLTEVKRGLRSILDLLAGRGGDEFRLAAPEPPARGRAVPAVKRGRAAAPRAKSAPGRNGSKRRMGR
ncbi:MAG TPA: MerR family transcriptional regulator [Vicinamibacterales bacterium]|jgi:DNA-binding transcriptional MerR regulator|nr:MerR family transcriptional regulator [Vicinamibacterales bacterium]